VHYTTAATVKITLFVSGMIMGAAVSTVYYNLKLILQANMPVIDYDLVLLIQPMLMLGMSIGV